MKIKAVMVIALASTGLYAGIVESGYEAVHKPKPESPGYKILIKNWRDEKKWGKDATIEIIAMRDAGSADEAEYGNAKYIKLGKTMKIEPGKSEDKYLSMKQIAYLKPYLTMRAKGGRFFLKDAKNNAWQDLVLDDEKVDGVRIWVSMREKE